MVEEAVVDRLELKVLRQIHKNQTLYLLLEPKTSAAAGTGSSAARHDGAAPEAIAKRLVRLGTGRNSVVFLASNSPRPTYNEKFLAVKFLKRDPDPEYTIVSERRFLEEAVQTQKFGVDRPSFVDYDCWGVVQENEADRADWKPLGGTPKAEESYRDVSNAGEVWAAVMGRYGLQGLFYAIELAQGTLYDVLDHDLPWLSLPSYACVPPRPNGIQPQQSLRAEALQLETAIQSIGHYFERNDFYNRSGYEILNLFKTTAESEANAVRNHAVLDLFGRVVETVAALHTLDGGDGRHLTHRDLKPGNIFLMHQIQHDGIGDLVVKLGDLGYLADFRTLTSSTYSLEHGSHNPAASIPGSQFFRAPEQSELPVEVRVSYDKASHNAEADSYTVSIRSHKLVRIQPGDYLILSDFFRGADEADGGRTLKIAEVLCDPRTGAIAGLRIDRPIKTQTSQDLVAFVVRATGYQTDGFSLGAILYDLASGGKNPEFFYTYCLIRFSEEFSGQKYSIEAVVDALCPDEPSLVTQATPLPQRVAGHGLSLARRWRYVELVMAARDSNDLIDSIIKTTFETPERQLDPKALRERLEDYKFREFDIVKDLLCDRRGIPIHKEIIRLVVKCMLRNLAGSYYSSQPNIGFVSPSNYNAASQLYQDVIALMATPDFALPLDFPENLQKDLLFKLRALGSSLGCIEREQAQVRAAGDAFAEELAS